MYGKAHGSARKGRQFYKEAFLDRRNPSEKTFSKLHQLLRKNRSFIANRSNCGPLGFPNPGCSTRQMALE